MEVTQSELMRIVHNDCVHIRNIHSAFNNIRAYKHVILLIYEIKDAFLQFMSFHLAVGVTDTNIGTKRLDNARHFCEALDAVVNKEYLSCSLHLEINCITNKIFIIQLHFRLYRLPVRRRCVNNAKIPCTHKAELQRAWNWSSSECKRVNTCLERFDFFFMTYTKFLLLINNQESKI